VITLRYRVSVRGREGPRRRLSRAFQLVRPRCSDAAFRAWAHNRIANYGTATASLLLACTLSLTLGLVRSDRTRGW
jgi:hypothetical protein